MRPLEILLVVLTLFSALVMGSRKAPRTMLLICGVLGLLTLLVHALVEGVHWQMAPAYAAALLPICFLSVQRRLMRRLLAGGMLLLLVGSCALSAFLPMFQLPAPTGPYLIGTQILPLVNDHPRVASSARPDGRRALMIQIWYPAAPSSAARASYRKLSETTPLSSYQAVLWTHARWNPPLAGTGGAFPVLLLNPAWNGRRTYYMYLVEELASHGYVVVGIDHTGNSGPTAFPDGEVTQPLNDPMLDFDAHSYAELNAYGAQQQAIQVDDDRFVLDQLELWNQESGNLYYRHLDMQRVGALGHSFGGSVAAEDCLEDARFKAALDMDGSYWGQVQQVGLAKPLMMIEEDVAQYTPQELQNHAVAVDHQFDLSDEATMVKSNGYQVLLHGSTHSSFTDRSLFSPWKRYSGEGTVPANREYMIIRSYVLAFFNKTLNGVDSPLLNANDRTFPEMTLRILHRPPG